MQLTFSCRYLLFSIGLIFLNRGPNDDILSKEIKPHAKRLKQDVVEKELEKFSRDNIDYYQSEHFETRKFKSPRGPSRIGKLNTNSHAPNNISSSIDGIESIFNQ